MAEKRRGVVITGAAGGLGRALCASYLADGVTVYAADCEAIEMRTGLVPVKLDVTDRAPVMAMAERAGRESHLDTWINAAEICAVCPVLTASLDDWERIIAINLTGTFNGCAAALSMLAAAGGGRIVNVGSISGQVGGSGVHPAYGASKAGVHALTKTYALEGARVGVLCNAVAPGLLDGGMARQFSRRQHEKRTLGTALLRLGKMEEVASVKRILAGPTNTYMTGAIVPVNGGALMP